MNEFLGMFKLESRILGAIFILIAAYILSLISKRIVDFVFTSIRRRVPDDHPHMIAKTKTIRILLKSVIDGFFLFVAILMMLSHFGFNIIPLLTGASIVGLAFSFGAQTVFKDYIAGFFILVEDQFNVGDKITIGETTGTVHKMTLRVTVLKDQKGNLIFISNSQIQSVTRVK